jgi:hypothetical protein
LEQLGKIENDFGFRWYVEIVVHIFGAMWQGNVKTKIIHHCLTALLLDMKHHK